MQSGEDWRPDFPGAAAETRGTFRSGVARVDVYAAFFSVQAHGAKLIGYGSSVADRGIWVERAKGIRTVPGAVVESALIDKAGHQRLVWYWYEVRGARLTSAVAVKLRESLATFGLPARSGIVALSAPCVPTCEAASLTLTEAFNQGLGTWTAGTASR